MVPAGVFTAYGMPAPADLNRFGSGLIHDTYYFTSGKEEYLLQKLNHHVFKDIKGMMSNIDKVGNFIRARFPHKTFITFLYTLEGQTYLFLGDTYWRMMSYIKDSKSYDQVSDIRYAFEAGRIIGDFHAMLAGFDATSLVETIPHFHDFDLRVKTFKMAQHEDVADRMQYCAHEVELLNSMAVEVHHQENSLNLPTRVAHNDTKLNNILFDHQDHAMCLVDLDTLMPGKVLFDTGDALRTMCNPSGEDGGHGEVKFEREIFLQFAKGFIQSTRGVLQENEVKLLPFSIIRMCTEQAIRFLTDYLKGDIYYRQPFPGFNLKATQVQLELLRLVKQDEPWLEVQLETLIKAC